MSKTADLIQIASQRGVALEARGDRLRVRGPALARDELRCILKQQKPELLRALRAEQGAKEIVAMLVATELANGRL